MRMLRFIILFVVVIATQNQVEAASNRFHNPEVEVIVAYLQAEHPQASPPIIDDPLITGEISGEYGGKSYKEYRASLLDEANTDVPSDLIKDYCEKNRHPQHLWPELISRIHPVLFNRQVADAIFPSKSHVKDDGWKQFYAKYPNSGGIIGFSRVGFNKQKTIAMFWIRWTGGSMLAKDQICVMHKQAGKWVRISVAIGPVIMS